MWQRLIESVKGLFRRQEPPEQEPEPPYAHLGEHHGAHASDDDPEDLHRGRRRLKETYTSHWDLDYLPREEAEALLRQQQGEKPQSAPKGER